LFYIIRSRPVETLLDILIIEKKNEKREEQSKKEECSGVF
jgi:hypothetical protein